MKKLFLILALFAAIATVVAQENHYDFCVINQTGYYTYYRIIDVDNQLVEVTYPCQNGDNYWYGYEKPAGKLIINNEVTYDGTVYHIVAIGDNAYYNCSDLRGVLELPQSIETVGEAAFSGCSKLSGLLDLTHVTSIGRKAFCNCSGLSGKLILNGNIESIEDSTFYNCSQFTDRLIIPSSVNSIGESAFESCGFTGMASLPASLVSLGSNAFKNCSHINRISIKASVPPVADSTAFDGLWKNMPVYVPCNTLEAYKNADGWSYFSKIEEKSLWSGEAIRWTQGEGTAESPYLIESAENLAWLAKDVNSRKHLQIDTCYGIYGMVYYVYTYLDVNAYQDTCFRVDVDIDLQNENGLEWEPIGNIHENDTNNYYTYFSGIFDGDEHQIHSYKIYNNEEGEIVHEKDFGIFGAVKSADIRNISAAPCFSVYSSKKTIGGICGRAINSNISNCHTLGWINCGNSQNYQYYQNYYSTVGGILGLSQSSHIENCISSTTISAYCWASSNNGRGVGGIVGMMLCDTVSDNTSDIFNCCFNGKMIDLEIGGGIVGGCKSIMGNSGTARIEHCCNQGPMLASNRLPDYEVFLGGIVGQVYDIDTLFVINCYSNDTITTKTTNDKYYAGGIIGKANNNSTLVVKNCYHVGPVTSTTTGGIIAQNTQMSIIRNSFYDENCAPDNGFGTPMNIEEMKTEAFVTQLNNGSTVYKMDTEPYQNDGFPVFGTDGLIFVGAEWYYEILNGDSSITYQNLRCVGDTAINSKRVKVIVKSNTLYDKKLETEITHEYLYEENGVVYWCNKTLEEFTVLYDFSAIEGEEWVIKVGEESITMHVYEVENQIINGLPYKKLTVADDENLFSGTIVSTIGHLTSFFPEKLIEKSSDFSIEQLRCYWLNGNLIYKIGNMDCDEIYQNLHIGIDETTAEIFSVYPNPTNGVINIKIGDNETCQETSLQQAMEYVITNITGQTVMQGTISSDHHQINVENLENGVYFIKIDGFTTRFVKY